MNITRLNYGTLKDAVVIKGAGSGGGVQINNQSKSVEITENGRTSVTHDADYTGLSKVDINVNVPPKNQEKAIEITENGTTEVVPDSGFTGLGKVIVNTNVETGGGGGTDMPVIGDGKTYLYIKIAEKGRMDVPLYFSQTVSNGVTIDWGDGSAPHTVSGTGKIDTTHTYADVGEYVISLNPADGCTLGLGHDKTDFCVMGRSSMYYSLVYVDMLKAAEVGLGNITAHAFDGCRCLRSVAFVRPPEMGVDIRSYAFYNCSGLSNIKFFVKHVGISSSSFQNCYLLDKIELPNIVNIGTCSSSFAYTGIASIILQKEATTIFQSQFENMLGLVSVVALGDIKNIGYGAFYNCLSAAFYDFSQCTSVPTLGTDVFRSNPSDCKIAVPDALYDEWIAATNWSEHASKIVKASEFNA